MSAMFIKIGGNTPTATDKVYEEMCDSIGIAPDYNDWWCEIYPDLACGVTLDQLVERFTQGEKADPTYATIARWLKKNYTAIKISPLPKRW